MELKAALPIAFVREDTGEILNAELATAIHRELDAELRDLMGKQPLTRKAALAVAEKRTSGLLGGLLKRAVESLESEWDQQKLDLND